MARLLVLQDKRTRKKSVACEAKKGVACDTQVQPRRSQWHVTNKKKSVACDTKRQKEEVVVCDAKVPYVSFFPI